MNYSTYEKLKLTSRYWLLGKAENNPDYYLTVRAFETALKYHTGVRKDNVTKEVYHQLNIFSMLRTMDALVKTPHIVLAVGLLHDTYEDYPESHKELESEFPELMSYLIRVSKIRDGEKISYEQYFGEMASCSVTSIVKVVDRVHNLSTMSGVFSYSKEGDYVKDVYTWFYPMIKDARRKFPEQEPAYEMLRSILALEVNLIENKLDLMTEQ